VEHQLLFRFDRLCIAGVSPHQEVHHGHLCTEGGIYEVRKKKQVCCCDFVLNGQLQIQTDKAVKTGDQTFCSWGKRDTIIRGLPDWTLSITEKGTSSMCSVTYQPTWNRSNSRVSEATNLRSTKENLQMKTTPCHFLPWLPLPQLQPRPECGGEYDQSSETGRCASSWAASSPWGPRGRSGNFWDLYSAET